jgi:hypothetical protein
MSAFIMAAMTVKLGAIEQRLIDQASKMFKDNGISDASKTDIESVARCLQTFEKTTVRKEIAESLAQIAKLTKSKDAVSSAARCLSKFGRDPDEAATIANDAFVTLALNMKSKDAAEKIIIVADCVSRFEKAPLEARSIGQVLGNILIITNNAEVFNDAVRLISRHEKGPIMAYHVVELLESLARNEGNKELTRAVIAFVSGDPSFFDKKLADLRSASRAKAETAADSLRKTVNLISRFIDDLHEAPEERERMVGLLSPEMCYAAIGQGEEVFTSSFNLIFDRMASELGKGDKAKGYALIIQKANGFDPHRIFYSGFLMKTSYFGAIDKVLPKREEYSTFVEGIINMMKNKEDAALLSVFFDKTLQMPTYAGRTRRALFQSASNEKLNPTARKAIRLMIKSFAGEFKDYNIQELIKDLPSFSGRIPEIWMKKQTGEEMPTLKIKQYFHYEDEDDEKSGIPKHRNIFIRKLAAMGYANSQGLTLEKALKSKEQLIYRKDRGGKRIEYVLEIAGRDVDLTGDCDDPSIDWIGHRGHSYQVEHTFGKVKELPTSKLIVLGSCGGFHVIPHLAERLGPNSLFISTKNMGVGEINNDVIAHTAEAIAFEGETNWGRITSSVSGKLMVGGEAFQSYSFPEDLPQILLQHL